MSNVINFNLRMEKELKEQASIIFENYGMTTSQALRMFLMNVIHTRKVPLTLDYQAERLPSLKLQKAISEAESNELLEFNHVDDLVRAINENN